MEKLVVAGPRRLARPLLAELQHAGVVHIDPLRPAELGEFRLSPQEESELRRWEAIVAGADRILAVLGVAPSFGAPFVGALEEAEAQIRPWLERAEVLGRERASLEEELQTIQLFGAAAQALASLTHGIDQSPRFGVIPFLVGKPEELSLVKNALDAALRDRYSLDSTPMDKQVAAVVVVMRRDLEAARSALSRLGLAELRFPGAFANLPVTQVARRMREREKIAPEELAGVLEELAKLGRESLSSLQALLTRARDEVLRYKAASDLAAGKYGVALMGWVPQDAKPKVEEALSKLRDEIVYTFEPVDEHHEADQVPVTLKNPAWAKPFELLHGFLNTPKYGSYDPTLNIALFFPLFFGMVVGDIGLALLFGYLAYFFGSRARQGKGVLIPLVNAIITPSVGRDVSKLLTWMAVSAGIWGFLYGEFFGTLAERLGIFYPNDGYHSGLFPILLNRLEAAETSTLLIVVCLLLGILQLFYAFGLRAYMGYKHHSASHMWEGIGYLAGLIGIVAYAYTFLSGVGAPLTSFILVAGLAVFVVAMFQVARSLGAIMGYLVMPIELLTKGGQILSYIRIYAVGLAGAVLYKLANDAGFAMAEQLGFVGGLIGFVVGAVMFALITLITIMGHVLQPIRLLWIEFGNNYGFFDEVGRAYRPFKSVREQ